MACINYSDPEIKSLVEHFGKSFVTSMILDMTNDLGYKDMVHVPSMTEALIYEKTLNPETIFVNDDVKFTPEQTREVVGVLTRVAFTEMTITEEGDAIEVSSVNNLNLDDTVVAFVNLITGGTIPMDKGVDILDSLLVDNWRELSQEGDYRGLIDRNKNLTRKLIDYWRFFGISEVEQNEDLMTNKLNISPDFEHDLSDKASTTIKFLVATALTEKRGEYLGLPTMAEFKSLWTFLEDELSDLPRGFEEDGFPAMQERLIYLSQFKPELKDILERLNTDTKKTQFYNAFSNTHVNHLTATMKKTHVEGQGSTVTVRVFDSEKGNIVSKLLDSVENKLKSVIGKMVDGELFVNTQSAERIIEMYDDLKESVIPRNAARIDELKASTMTLMQILGFNISSTNAFDYLLSKLVDEYHKTDLGKTYPHVSEITNLSMLLDKLQYVFHKNAATKYSIEQLITSEKPLTNTAIKDERSISWIVDKLKHFQPISAQNGVLGAGGKFLRNKSKNSSRTKQINLRLKDPEYLRSLSVTVGTRHSSYVKKWMGYSNLNGIYSSIAPSFSEENVGDEGDAFSDLSPIDEYVVRVNMVLSTFQNKNDAQRTGHVIGLTNADKSTTHVLTGAPIQRYILDVSGELVQIEKDSSSMFTNYLLNELESFRHASEQLHGVADENGDLDTSNVIAKEDQIQYFHYGKTPSDGKGNFNHLYIFSGLSADNLTAVGDTIITKDMTPERVREIKDAQYLFEVLYEVVGEGVIRPKALILKELYKDLVLQRYIRNVLSVAVRTELREALRLGVINVKNGEVTSKYINPRYAKDGAMNGIATYALNEMIAAIEMTQLFTGSPAQYKKSGSNFFSDFKKRIPAMNASGREARITNKVSYTSSVIEDVILPSEYFMDDANLKNIAAATGVSFEVVKEKLAKSYLDVDMTDAQAWITMDRYVEAMGMFGEMSKEKKEAHADIKKWLKNPTDENYNIAVASSLSSGFMMSPLKTVHAEYKYFPKLEQRFMVYNKQSEAPLNPLFTINTELDNLRVAMEGVSDHVVVNSGRKTGGVGITSIQKDGKIMDSKDIKLNPISLSNEFYFLQVETPNTYHYGKDKLEGSQVKKNILQNIVLDQYYDNLLGVDLARFHHETDRELSMLAQRELYNEIGYNPDKEDILSNDSYQKLMRLLVKDSSSKDIPYMIREALLDPKTPLDALFQYKDKLQSSLNSIINKRIVKLKVPGGSFVQMSSFGIKKGVKFSALKSKQGILWLNQESAEKGLKPPRFERIEKEVNGETVVSYEMKKGQVLLPHSILRQFPELQGLSLEELKKVVDPRIFEGIGYRIPNQGMSSIDTFEIVGILPPTMGDTIVAYNEITKKTGSDFDIDKMYIMLPNYKINYNWDKINRDFTRFDNDDTNFVFSELAREIPAYKSLSNFQILREIIDAKKDEDVVLTENEKYLDEQFAEFISESKNSIEYVSRISKIEYNDSESLQEPFQSIVLTPTQKENIVNLKASDSRWNKYSDEDIQRFIESVFPDSKVKDIVYHGGTVNGFFDKSQIGKSTMSSNKNDFGQPKAFYFTTSKDSANTYGTTLLYILDVKNAVILNQEQIDNGLGLRRKNTFKDVQNLDLKGKDGFILKDIFDAKSLETLSTKDLIEDKEGLKQQELNKKIESQHGDTIGVFEPEQIYILNSDQAISDMDKFVSQPTQQDYSKYLESLNKPNTNPILRDNQTNIEEIITQLEKDGLLEIDCKGFKAKEGLTTNSNPKFGDWEIIKDLKGKPSHKQGGIDLSIKGNTIEAEGNELVLKNSVGDLAIIPKKDRLKIKDIISNNDEKGLTNYISKLPKEPNKAGDGGVYSDKYVKNNFFNRIFRRNDILEKQIMDENKSLYNVGKLRDFKVLEATGKSKQHLEETNRNPEYFPKGDTWFPYLDDISQPIKLPNKNKYRTLVNDDNLSDGQLRDAVKFDFISHSLHNDKRYNDLSTQLSQKLLTKYDQKFIDNNGGVDAYVRGILSDSEDYKPYRDETSFIEPEFINEFKNYIKTGK